MSNPVIALGGQLTDRRTHIRFINREPAITGIGRNNRDWFIGFEYYSEVGSGKCRFALFFYEKPGTFCYRRVVAEWLEDALGIEVHELRNLRVDTPN